MPRCTDIIPSGGVSLAPLYVTQLRQYAEVLLHVVAAQQALSNEGLPTWLHQHIVVLLHVVASQRGSSPGAQPLLSTQTDPVDMMSSLQAPQRQVTEDGTTSLQQFQMMRPWLSSLSVGPGPD